MSLLLNCLNNIPLNVFPLILGTFLHPIFKRYYVKGWFSLETQLVTLALKKITYVNYSYFLFIIHGLKPLTSWRNVKHYPLSAAHTCIFRADTSKAEVGNPLIALTRCGWNMTTLQHIENVKWFVRYIHWTCFHSKYVNLCPAFEESNQSHLIESMKATRVSNFILLATIS